MRSVITLNSAVLQVSPAYDTAASSSFQDANKVESVWVGGPGGGSVEAKQGQDKLSLWAAIDVPICKLPLSNPLHHSPVQESKGGGRS